MDPLLSIDEVSRRLAVPRARTYELIRRGMLPAVRLGRTIRVAPAVLENFVARGGEPLPHAAGDMKPNPPSQRPAQRGYWGSADA